MLENQQKKYEGLERVQSGDETNDIFDLVYMNRFEKKKNCAKHLTKHGMLKLFEDNRFPWGTTEK